MTVSRGLDPVLLIFDADNTLWDTNAVFRGAQLALLRPFAERMAGLSPDKELVALRQVDRLLFQRLGKFEYDFQLLAVAMVHYYLNGCSAAEAVCRVMEGAPSSLAPIDAALAEQAYRDYATALQEIPPLFPDTLHVLETLQKARSLQAGLAVTLFSEGDPDRLGRILTSHGLAGESLFHAIHIGPKSPESLERFREVGQDSLGLTKGKRVRTIVVGDSLKREIKYGNQIGATTVYIPAGFLGAEQSTEEDEKPAFSLSRLGELPLLMRDLQLV